MCCVVYSLELHVTHLFCTFIVTRITRHGHAMLLWVSYLITIIPLPHFSYKIEIENSCKIYFPIFPVFNVDLFLLTTNSHSFSALGNNIFFFFIRERKKYKLCKHPIFLILFFCLSLSKIYLLVFFFWEEGKFIYIMHSL